MVQVKIASQLLVLALSLSILSCENKKNFFETSQENHSPRASPTTLPSLDGVTNADLGLSPDFDPFELPLITRQNGEVLKAFGAALEAFHADENIPITKRHVENYDVEFRQNGIYYFVYFSAHSSPQEKIHPSDSGETSLGKSVMFIIGKKDFAVKRRYFFS